MSQQINLLNPALIKKSDLLNANNVAITLGLLLALMLGYYSYAAKQLSTITLQHSQVAEKLSAMQAQLQQATTLRMPRALNKALLDEITQLEQKEKMQQQVLQMMRLSSATPEKGYAALMRAFAKQSLEGLWLTSFSIDSQTENMNISGRTLQADLVPEYITRLGNEPALKGKLFAALNMRLPKEPATITTPALSPQANLNSINNATAMPSNTVNRSNQAQINTPQHIEFTLQSAHDKSAPSATNIKLGDKP